MKRGKIFALIIAVGLTLSLMACAAPAPPPAPTPPPAAPAPAPAPPPAPAPAPIELKLGHNSSTKSGSHAGFMEPWAREVEKATNGKVKITIYPSQTLFKAKEAIVATEQGITDIGWVLVGFFPGRFPLADVVSLPFVNLYEGTVDGRKLGPAQINSHILMELYEKFPEMQAEWSGVKVLILHTAGPTQLWSNKLISNLDDIKGLKIRSYSGPDAEMWQMLGASPIPMPLPAVYEAAEKGVLEAANVDFGGIAAYRLHEVFTYRVNFPLTIGRYALIMNQDKWDSLPPDIQDIIQGLSGIPGAEFAGGGMHMGVAGHGIDDTVRERAKEAGTPLIETDLSPEDMEKWRQIGKQLQEKYIASLEAKGLPGQKILDEALSLIEKYK